MDSALPPWSYRRMKPFHARTAVLEHSPAADVRLSFYAPDGFQDLHSHPLPVVSLVLGGTVGEMVGGSQAQAEACWLSLKPPDVRHSDAYGPDGTIILSAVVRDAELWAAVAPLPEWKWRPVNRSIRREILASALESDRHRSGDELALELLALAFDQTAAAGTPPSWLVRTAQRLREEPLVPLSQIASEEGVHRVHLARTFRRFYGISPRAFRLRVKTSAALGASIFRGTAAVTAAHEAGFADQSHMARAVKAATGVSLSRLLKLGRAEGSRPSPS